VGLNGLLVMNEMMRDECLDVSMGDGLLSEMEEGMIMKISLNRKRSDKYNE
jgi:hypothetical protein